LQQGNFSFQNWIAKIKDDLPGAWVAGLGFWPLVDLVSYSLIPKDWIPLFVNACSLVWTIYLSIVANRQSNVVEHKD
jgi:protein Mpv17